ncbi:16S rRNA (guanine(966)-N(2))-methyltransferase RsmD [Abditibacterium utsteinense]|uniref:16S rRNA (Guanine(966)-N(2))-methyltransferase RsmD n=1 Tax=Abditibacterium utsteinense TaxID=1960156 RepID=A0A2S8SUQ0_9BACT|nr:16S rRNA (guanine(966)-N(2))-methyltransferase RsmD [Abditibacterium utsteinense]PQV64525.1 16S rRNA (guanine(966)-N(2))-methyltransferase RsmD [Abditibacterium utsteinense]
MRIEGGEARGRTLQTPNGQTTRPTDGRTREMLFNIIGPRIVGARFLDLYAGSGAIGIEALSRGADFVVFIEQEFAAIRSIKANLKTLGYEKRALVWNGNARTAVGKLCENGEKFDLIVADPPFTLPDEPKALCLRIDAAPGLLNNESIGTLERAAETPETEPGLLVVQHSHRVPAAEMTHFQLFRQKKAGESMLSFYVLDPNSTIKI